MSDPRAPGETSIGDETPITSLVTGFDDFERIGHGGFSSVYSARQVRLGRPVAIKVLDADLSTDADRRSFERECQAMGVLSRHPNIATMYSEAYTTDGRPCLVMELYHGNYRDRLDETGPLPIGEFLALGVKIGAALQAAHDAGVLHRDIKPHNIFVSDFGEPALGDFGISTIEGERTITGAAALSVAYSAPEVIEDDAADYLSDVYSLTATMHHLLTGASPFAAPQVGAVVKRILNEEPDPVVRDDAPRSLRDLLRSGLAKRPSDRPDSAGDLAASLHDIQSELGYDRTPIPLRRSERVDPGAGADWANSSGESSARRRAAMKAAGHDDAAEDEPRPPELGDVEATILPPGGSRLAASASAPPASPPLDPPPLDPPPMDPPPPDPLPGALAGNVAPDPATQLERRGNDEATVRRASAGLESAGIEPTIESVTGPTAAEPPTDGSPSDEPEFEAPSDGPASPPAERGRGWAVDVAIAVTVVALLAFALSRML